MTPAGPWSILAWAWILRSRYFDPYNLDKEPMPPDDPASHVFMHRVYGMRATTCGTATAAFPTIRTPAGAIAWRCTLP